jgi:RNA polymerase sigma-70 factor (ECF subfamily)
MTVQAQISDEHLLQMIKAGDEEAFATLYRRRQPGVYRFALRMCGSEAAAEDVTQEVFMALMRNPGFYEAGRGAVSTYLYGIARNQVLRRLQREQHYVTLLDDEESDEPQYDRYLISPDDPLGDLTRNETAEAVRQAVLAMPAHYREVVVLCELHDLNYDEAAEIIGCPIGTVRSRLSRARALLIKKLKTLHAASMISATVAAARYVV